MANIIGNNGNETLIGTDDDDVVVGAGGNDVLKAAGGDDVFEVAGDVDGFDTFDGGDGFDRIEATSAGTVGFASGFGPEDSVEEIAGVSGGGTVLRADGHANFQSVHLIDVDGIVGDGSSQTIVGSDGSDDVITGAGGNDVLKGGGGNDMFKVAGNSDGFDTFDGGAGFDTIVATSAGTIGFISGFGPEDSVEGIVGISGGGTVLRADGHANFSGTTLTDIDRILGDGSSQTIVGSDGSDVINGAGGNDVLKGGGGNDTFEVAGNTDGFDAFDGGAGIDTIVATSAGTIGFASGFGPEDSVEGIVGMSGGGTVLRADGHANFSGTTLTDIDRILGDGSSQTIIGSDGADIINGAGGNDVLNGGGGNDTFEVAGDIDGFDAFDGGAGVDTIVATSAGTIGFTSGFGPEDSIEEIVGISGGGTVLRADGHANFSGTTLTDIDRILGDGSSQTIIGSDGSDDVIVGAGGNDVLKGGGGNDTFEVAGNSDGFDAFDGGTGVDTIVATSAGTIGFTSGFGSEDSIEEIVGVSGGGTVLRADGHADFSGTTLTDIDSVLGDGSSQTITTSTSHSGTTTYDGAGGNDTLNIALTQAQAKNAAIVSLIQGYAGPAGGLDTTFSASLGIEFEGFETVKFGLAGSFIPFTFDNVIVGTYKHQALNGVVGVRNLIFGEGGNDTLTGADKADILVGGDGGDRLDGGGGSDLYLYNPGDDADTYADSGSASDEDVILATGDTTIFLNGNFGAASGIEKIDGGGHAVNVSGTYKHQALDFSSVELDGIGAIFGGGGNDTITGTSGDDIIEGGDGGDRLDGGDGSDTYRYNAGDDADTYADSGSASDEDVILATGDATIFLNGNFGVASGIEKIDGGGHAVNVSGTYKHQALDFSNVELVGIGAIFGGGGNDTITGTGGDDVIEGGDGGDRLDGGEGSDTYRYNAGDDADTYADSGSASDEDVILATGDATIFLNGNFGAASGIEKIDAGGHAVNVSGTYKHQALDFSGVELVGIGAIFGGGGNDTITGTSGDDIIEGGDGGDRLDGGEGSDTYRYNAGDDADTYTDSGSASDEDVILATGDATIFLNGNFGAASGIEKIDADGHVVNISGTYKHQVLDFSSVEFDGIGMVSGGGGNDIITTALTSNGGAITYDGGTGTDTVRISLTIAQALDAAIIAELNTFTGADQTFTELGNLTVQNFTNLVFGVGGSFYAFDNVVAGATGGNDSLTGGGDKDLIVGLNYHDTLSGGANNDVLIGGHGNDVLNGDAGNDAFLYSGTNNGLDIVNGGTGTDTIGAIADNTNIGLASNGLIDVERITGGGHANVKVVSSGGSDILDFSGVEIDGVSEINLGNYHDTVTTSNISAANYRGGHGNDTFNIGEADATFLYTGTNNGADTFALAAGATAPNGAGTSTILAGADGTVIGLASGFNNGVDVIDSGGFANVRVNGTGGSDNLNFSNVQFNGSFEINGGNYHDTITASDLSAGRYRGGHGNDTFMLGAAAAVLLYSGTNNGADAFVGNVPDDGVLSSILAEADGTKIGLASGFANSVDVIDAGNFDDVRIVGTGGSDTLDFSNVMFGGTFVIDGGNYHDTITTSNASAGQYRGAHGNDTFTIGDADATFLYNGTNNGSDSFIGNDGDQVTSIKVEADGTKIGLASGFANGVDFVNLDGHTGIRIVGTGGSDTLDFSDVAFLNVVAGDAFEIDGGNYHDTITASNHTFSRILGAHGNDTLIAGNASVDFLYRGTNNGFDSFINDADATSRIVADSDGARIGLASGFGAGTDVDVITGNGHTGVTVKGTGGSDILDFSNVSVIGIERVDGGNYHDTITASNSTFMRIEGAHGNDMLLAGDAEVEFLYDGTNNGSDSFLDGGIDGSGNGAGLSTISAESDGTTIGLASGFTNGVDVIDSGGNSGVRVFGTGGSDTFDFSNVQFNGALEIDGGNYHDTITASNLSEAEYRGGHGNDTFVFATAAANATLLDFDDIGNDRIDLSDFSVSLAAIDAATSDDGTDTTIDLAALGGVAGTSITLENVLESDLDFTGADDFII